MYWDKKVFYISASFFIILEARIAEVIFEEVL